MTRDGMVAFLRGNFYKRIRHRFFSLGEYIYCAEDGNIYDENGYLFEDWNSPSHCGLRIRTGGNWESGWEIIDYYRNKSLADNHNKHVSQCAPKVAVPFRKKPEPDLEI